MFAAAPWLGDMATMVASWRVIRVVYYGLDCLFNGQSKSSSCKTKFSQGRNTFGGSGLGVEGEVEAVMSS